MRRYNPTMNTKLMNGQSLASGAEAMTLKGTIHKSAILLMLVFAGATYAWTQLAALGEIGVMQAQKYAMIAGVIGLVLVIATVFLKKFSPFLAPLYALIEGLFLGSISMVMERFFPGVVFQAVMGTVCVFGIMLFLYDRRIIRVTNKLRSIVYAATGAIFLMYIATWILSFFGIQMPFLHTSGPIGIGISVLIIGVAAFNLLLDFDMIENYSGRVEKYMEWYCGFGMLITIVWLYVEILQLLARLRD